LSWNFLASSSSDRGLPGPPRLTSTRASSSSPVAGGHAQDGGEGVRERRAAALVLDAAHQGGQGEAAGVTGGGVGEVLVGHAEAAAEQRRGDRVGAAERRVVPGGRPCLGLGWLGDRAQDGLGDAQLDRCDVGGGESWARSRRAASTPTWVKWLHGYGLKTTRGSSQSVGRNPRQRFRIV
jgi:hypothetical protein